MKSKLGAAFAAACILVCGTVGASAAPLITNGGFETGYFTGWTITGDGVFVTNNGADINPAGAGYLPNSGNCIARG